MKSANESKCITAKEEMFDVVNGDDYERYIEVLVEMQEWTEDKVGGDGIRTKEEEEVFEEFVTLNQTLFKKAENISCYETKNGYKSRNISKEDDDLVGDLCYAIESEDVWQLEEVREEINKAHEQNGGVS